MKPKYKRYKLEQIMSYSQLPQDLKGKGKGKATISLNGDENSVTLSYPRNNYPADNSQLTTSTGNNGEVIPFDSRNQLRNSPADFYLINLGEDLQEQFKLQHPHLYSWINSKLGQKYQEMRL
jgi:hypothetical protein